MFRAISTSPARRRALVLIDTDGRRTWSVRSRIFRDLFDQLPRGLTVAADGHARPRDVTAIIAITRERLFGHSSNVRSLRSA